MAVHANSTRRIRPDELRVDPAAHPRWVAGSTRSIAAGAKVYCTGGMAEVIRVLGRTENGSRLLELRLEDRSTAPFYAAASNVLVAPES